MKLSSRQLSVPFAAIMLVFAGVGCDVARVSPVTARWSVEDLQGLLLEEELRIGSLDDPNYGFTLVTQVDVDDQGQVYALDIRDAAINVYSPQGEFVRRIGGRGDGPGEHQGQIVFGVLGDTVWTWSGSGRDPGRITIFGKEGQVRSTWPVEPAMVTSPGGCTVLSPYRLGADGLFVSWISGGHGGPCLNQSAAPLVLPDSVDIPSVRFTSRGEVLDTVGILHRTKRHPEPGILEVGRSRYVVPQPPQDGPLRLNRSDGFFEVEREAAKSPGESSFRVTRRSLSGDIVYTTAYLYRPVGYSDAVLDDLAGMTARASVQALPSSDGGYTVHRPIAGDSAAARQAIRRRLAFPEFQSPISSGLAAADGSLWLRREDVGMSTIRWIVIDPAGTPIGEVEVPKSRRVAWSGGDVVWAVERDEFDVPWIVRYRLTRARPA